MASAPRAAQRACSREELDHFNRIMTSALGGLDPRTIEAGAASKLPLLFSDLLVVSKTVKPLDKAISELGVYDAVDSLLLDLRLHSRAETYACLASIAATALAILLEHGGLRPFASLLSVRPSNAELLALLLTCHVASDDEVRMLLRRVYADESADRQLPPVVQFRQLWARHLVWQHDFCCLLRSGTIKGPRVLQGLLAHLPSLQDLLTLVDDAPVDQPLAELELKVLQAADRLPLDSCPRDAGGRGTDKAAPDEKTRAALLLLLQRYVRQFGQLSWTGGGFSLPGVLREALVAFTEACKRHHDDGQVMTTELEERAATALALVVRARPPRFALPSDLAGALKQASRDFRAGGQQRSAWQQGSFDRLAFEVLAAIDPSPPPPASAPKPARGTSTPPAKPAVADKTHGASKDQSALVTVQPRAAGPQVAGEEEEEEVEGAVEGSSSSSSTWIGAISRSIGWAASYVLGGQSSRSEEPARTSSSEAGGQSSSSSKSGGRGKKRGGRGRGGQQTKPWR